MASGSWRGAAATWPLAARAAAGDAGDRISRRYQLAGPLGRATYPRQKLPEFSPIFKFASGRFDKDVEIFPPVVVGDLLARLIVTPAQRFSHS
jgi:hypothetical protein